MPDFERAPLALPSQQRFRIYQEVNHLRVLGPHLKDTALNLAQRNAVVDALEHHGKRSFTQIKALLKLPGSAKFNLEDEKRLELKGNATSALLSKKDFFGPTWFDFSHQQQDAIVMRLLTEESEAALIAWLQTDFELDEPRANAIANASLAEGYGNLCAEALARILPCMQGDVMTYDKAVQAAGFDHHSQISHAAVSGEILPSLPYYGEYLQRHVGFGTGNPEDPPEKRFGKIANPTVHIGLNQVRTVVNALIRRYGHPREVIVEVARELKQNQEQRKEQQQQQAQNQMRNERLRADAAGILGIAFERVRQADIQKLILWEELSRDPAERRCPYSGVQISAAMVLSDEVEIEHILPFSQTLDDSLNNKTVAMRNANRDKGNATPWQAFGERTVPGYDFDAILQRAELMPKNKRYRFGKDGYQQWLREDKDFLARALNDTRYLSRVAREYLRLVCPGARVIPGQMTAMLRGRFGLNTVLGVNGEKNRNDHRHHAVDACVIGVTDQGMLQQFARASASAREKHLTRLVETMPEPFPNYRAHVERAVKAIWVSHKPDHSHEGAMHNETAYGLLAEGRVRHHKPIDGKRELVIETLKVIPITSQRGADRHSRLDDGSPRPYKGYKGDSNYCIDIVRNEKGKWDGEVVSTFAAYQIVRAEGVARLRDSRLSISGKPLVMRLIVNDYVRLNVDGAQRTMRVASINSAGRLSLADHHEANVDARNRAPSGLWRYTYKQAGSLQSALAHRVTISPIGEVNDPGFKG